MKKIDVNSYGVYPAKDLSNFAYHVFNFQGVGCTSMEGLLQSLKESDPVKQSQICKMKEWMAKKYGLTLPDWRKNQILYWKGMPYLRDDTNYQALLDLAYKSLFQNAMFKRALKDTGDAILTHTIGKKDIRETILTEEEFVSRLTNLRKCL